MLTDKRARFPKPQNGWQLFSEFVRSGAWKQCNATERVVYLALVDRCGEGDLQCYPSIETLAQDTGLKPRNLRFTIARLQAKGFIVVESRRKDSGLQQSNYFRIVIPFPEGPELVYKSRGGAKLTTPAKLTHTPVKLATPGGAKIRQGGVANLPPKETTTQETIFKRPTKTCAPEGACDGIGGQGKQKSNDPLGKDHVGFCEFYDTYPQKVGRKDAFRAYRKHVTTDALHAKLIARTREAMNGLWASRSKDKIPYPATWINGLDWQDDSSDLKAPPIHVPASVKAYHDRVQRTDPSKVRWLTPEQIEQAKKEAEDIPY